MGLLKALKAPNPTKPTRVSTQSRACSRRPVVRVLAKQYVPSDSFGGISPERTAAQSLNTFFTFIAAKIVLAQLEGSGRGALAAYDKTAYDDLSTFLQNEKIGKDPEAWLAKLMRINSGLALRVMEVRVAYANEDFEWDNLKKIALKDVQDGNLAVMKSSAAASLKAVLDIDVSMDDSGTAPPSLPTPPKSPAPPSQGTQ